MESRSEEIETHQEGKTPTYVHQDESGVDDIEGLVLKRQRLTYVHLQKLEVFRKRSAKWSIAPDQVKVKPKQRGGNVRGDGVSRRRGGLTVWEEARYQLR